MDVTAALTTIGEATTNAGIVGAAILGVVGVIAGFRWIRRAFA